jgi:hypothetical protein
MGDSAKNLPGYKLLPYFSSSKPHLDDEVEMGQKAQQDYSIRGRVGKLGGHHRY